MSLSSELSEGLGDESLFLETRNGGLGRAFAPGKASQGPAQPQFPFSLILLVPEGNRDRTRKGERLDEEFIINLAGKLRFRGTWFQGPYSFWALIFLTSDIQSLWLLPLPSPTELTVAGFQFCLSLHSDPSGHFHTCSCSNPVTSPSLWSPTCPLLISPTASPDSSPPGLAPDPASPLSP